MVKKLQIALLSYSGAEHRDYLQAHLNGMTLAFETLGIDAFSVKRYQLIPDRNIVDRVLDEIDKSGALAILGPFDSETAALVIPKATQIGIPVLSTGASSPLLNDGDLSNTTFFRLVSSDRENLRQLAEWISMEYSGATVLTVAERRTPVARYGDDHFIIFQQFAFQRSLCVVPVRYERGNIAEIIDHCKKVVTTRPCSVGAVVALGYTSDTIALLRALHRGNPYLPMYTINPKRAVYEDSGLNGIRSVASDVEYATVPLWQSFRRQFLARFADQRQAPFLVSAIYAYDLVQILHHRIVEARIAEIGDVRQARKKLLGQLRDSRQPAEKALISNGIFTSNQELTFHSRNIVLRKGKFVEYDGRSASGSRVFIATRGAAFWHSYKKLIERFGFIKHNVDFWIVGLGILGAIGGLLLLTRAGVLRAILTLRDVLRRLL